MRGEISRCELALLFVPCRRGDKSVVFVTFCDETRIFARRFDGLAMLLREWACANVTITHIGISRKNPFQSARIYAQQVLLSYRGFITRHVAWGEGSLVVS